MEAEDAQKALRLAFKHDANGDTAAAIKWAKKSIAIYKTPSAEALLVRLEKSGASGNGASASSSSAAGASSSADGLRSRTAASSNGRATSSSTTHEAPKRAYTQAQMEVVTRIKKAGADFYQVLGVEKTVDENGIKKAYKKLALQLHPDKNGAPGADEAFKSVSKAFSILTDADKRAAYDRYGGDPDNARSAAGAAAAGHGNPFGGGMRGTPFRGGGMYADEMDPNDLFNMFFGGGMGGAQFGGTTFTFGGPGMRTHQFRQQRPGPRRHQAEPQNAGILLQLLPLIVLGLFSLLAYAPTLFSTPDPNFTWAPSTNYKTQRVTETYKVPYYVNDNNFNNHPFVAGENSKRDLAGFEKRVENAYKQAMYSDCERKKEYQQRRLASTRGFLGIGGDEEAAKRILAEVYESCEKLKPFGIYL